MEIDLFESTGLTTLDLCVWVWTNSAVYIRKVDTRDELLTSILNNATRIKKRENQLGRKSRDLRTRVTKCVELDGGIS
jgi:hypothetical protein